MASKTPIQSLGKRIDKIRQERGLSFQEMAFVCDMEKSQVYNICTKGVDVRYTTLIKVAKGFEMPLTELLNFK